MPALTQDTIRTAAETFSHHSDHLHDSPEPDEAFALVEPLLDVPGHTSQPRSRSRDHRVARRRVGTGDQHTLHYVLDDLHALHGSAADTDAGCGRCP
ncbi:hypothetical protein [Streptomyces sp. NPDC102462]|uniref:hypothetical protein n=1 Tax=Streptomyces sp. NPDC102462 TaxID=3366178 RepID=UPI00380A8B42